MFWESMTMIQMYKDLFGALKQRNTQQKKKIVQLGVCCLPSKLLFIRNLGAMVAGDKGFARIPIHLPNPGVCKRLNMIHHNLPSQSETPLPLSNSATSLLLPRKLTEKSQSLKLQQSFSECCFHRIFNNPSPQPLLTL